MSKFDSFYRSVDRLNAAIARAEQYLLTHPAGNIIIPLPDGIGSLWFIEESEAQSDSFGLGLHNQDKLCIWGLWYDGDNDELSENLELVTRLHELPAKDRALVAGLIPELIKQADSALEFKVGDVDEVTQAIDAALPQPEPTSSKPKRSTRKKQ
ncbi:MAG: hypothetical protein ACK6DC_08390 [Planctomycetota bacterium]|jgi:hypothetical protein